MIADEVEEQTTRIREKDQAGRPPKSGLKDACREAPYGPATVQVGMAPGGSRQLHGRKNRLVVQRFLPEAGTKACRGIKGDHQPT